MTKTASKPLTEDRLEILREIARVMNTKRKRRTKTRRKRSTRTKRRNTRRRTAMRTSRMTSPS
jgi:hypothetical protein